METNTTASAASDRSRAELFLASAFIEIMASQGGDLEQIEDACVSAGHELMAATFGLALERLDGALRSRLPHGVRPHDRRSRTIATKMGDVSFSCRRFRGACGNTVVPLADVSVNLFFTSFAKQACRSRKGGFTGCANVFSPIPVTA